MKYSSIILALILTMWVMKAEAHGLLTNVRFHPPSVQVKTLFSETQPVVDAEVTIYSPATSEVVWQTGRTDQTGSFAFLPDTAGDWVFLVDDQKGHAKKLTITVPADFLTIVELPTGIAASKSGQLTALRERTYQAIAGLALIFGITGIFYGVRSRQTAHDKSVRK